MGFHGCDETVAERLLAGEDFKESRNDYDWLGPGIYFWEANPRRGLEFASELKRVGRGKVETPAVVGAIAELGLCLDLTTSSGIRQVYAAHEELKSVVYKAGGELPTNDPDLLRRNLDCAVINVLHRVRSDGGEAPIDTVRGVFIEGRSLYPTSGFYEKTHIQITVCNPDCIKGVFRVPTRFLD